MTTTPKPEPATEPQGSEEPIEPVTELEAEKSTSKILRAQLAQALSERDEARATKDMHKERQEEAWAELAQAREEIKQRRDELRSLDMRLTVERAAREREKSHFAEQWTLEEARFMGMLHRAEQAEATVRNLENAIIDWETEPQYRVTNLNWLHRVAKDILARAKEGESRG